MNRSHLQFLSSPEWAAMLQKDLLPWIESVGDLGDDVLEIGPGPGLTTDLLRRRVSHLTAVELDATLAHPLRERLGGTNVDVICTDATRSGLDANRFSAATCFSMLHHMPTPADQDALFTEVSRLLRPGAIFVGTDSIDLDVIRAGHVDDVFVPVGPDTLADRLAAAGFVDTQVDVGDYQFRFVARMPTGDHLAFAVPGAE
jgi:SAM-dependent methyltransferase